MGCAGSTEKRKAQRNPRKRNKAVTAGKRTDAKRDPTNKGSTPTPPTRITDTTRKNVVTGEKKGIIGDDDRFDNKNGKLSVRRTSLRKPTKINNEKEDEDDAKKEPLDVKEAADSSPNQGSTDHRPTDNNVTQTSMPRFASTLADTSSMTKPTNTTDWPPLKDGSSSCSSKCKSGQERPSIGVGPLVQPPTEPRVQLHSPSYDLSRSSLEYEAKFKPKAKRESSVPFEQPPTVSKLRIGPGPKVQPPTGPKITRSSVTDRHDIRRTSEKIDPRLKLITRRKVNGKLELEHEHFHDKAKISGRNVSKSSRASSQSSQQLAANTGQRTPPPSPPHYRSSSSSTAVPNPYWPITQIQGYLYPNSVPSYQTPTTSNSRKSSSDSSTPSQVSSYAEQTPQASPPQYPQPNQVPPLQYPQPDQATPFPYPAPNQNLPFQYPQPYQGSLYPVQYTEPYQAPPLQYPLYDQAQIEQDFSQQVEEQGSYSPDQRFRNDDPGQVIYHHEDQYLIPSSGSFSEPSHIAHTRFRKKTTYIPIYPYSPSEGPQWPKPAEELRPSQALCKTCHHPMSDHSHDGD